MSINFGLVPYKLDKNNDSLCKFQMHPCNIVLHISMYFSVNLELKNDSKDIRYIIWHLWHFVIYEFQDIGWRMIQQTKTNSLGTTVKESGMKIQEWEEGLKFLTLRYIYKIDIAQTIILNCWKSVLDLIIFW